MNSLQQTLPGHYYVDPTLFELERDRIFRKSWHFVGSEAALRGAGKYRALRVAGTPVVVVSDRGGELRAFINMCRHRGSRLVDAEQGACSELRCPYHGWVYSLDGALLDTPWFGEESPFDRGSLSLLPVSLANWRGLLFVSIDPAGPLTAQLGAIPKILLDCPLEAMIEVQGFALSARLNWKVYIDQFTEYYHSPDVHALDAASGIQHYRAVPIDQGMLMRAPEGSAFYGGLWLWNWPNWTISRFAGGVKISSVSPVTAQESEIRFCFLFESMDDGAAMERQQVIDATLRILHEDVRALVRVQETMTAGVFDRPGPLHPGLEQATAYFQNRIRETLA